MTRVRSMLLGGALAMSWACLIFGAAAQEAAGRLQVYELVRSLVVLQNQVVHGDLRAHASQRKLLDHIAEVIKGMPSEEWEDIRNVRAVISFILGGGDPRAVRPILDKFAARGEIGRVAEASVLYAEGKRREAREAFKEIKPRSLETSLAGHVALVKGVLLDGSDRENAIKNLDDARLLSPGTIVEEAALRREIPIVARAGDFDKFSYLLARYYRRFGASVYAQGLAPEVAAVVAVKRFVKTPEQFAQLERSIAVSSPEVARDLYLMLAQSGVAEGYADMVRFASERASQLSQLDTVDGNRAKLYGAAVMIVSDDMDEGLSRLMSVEKSRLERADVEIVDAAFNVATAVRQWPETPKAPPLALQQRVDDKALESFAANQTSQSVLRARDTLAAVDTVLQEID
ncbi:putative chemotaxis protein [Candidatus Filomicrobium marinum]|uniref:Putative chemotaxis protein n=1 Tax=Candidatus Filomicrobium marinum TaxID=1608628 RepID=A0A0D6JKL2_9HYPH|nr:hypothetical protein [Candidatus Filomicrobium marinum]CFX55669.1 putative chemotaxis protein [Candidatus Filomicrobium marinum]CPR22200.1 putative chemotaxis protein [Candidatus Filomicrobium marinum]